MDLQAAHAAPTCATFLERAFRENQDAVEGIIGKEFTFEIL